MYQGNPGSRYYLVPVSEHGLMVCLWLALSSFLRLPIRLPRSVRQRGGNSTLPYSVEDRLHGSYVVWPTDSTIFMSGLSLAPPALRFRWVYRIVAARLLL